MLIISTRYICNAAAEPQSPRRGGLPPPPIGSPCLCRAEARTSDDLRACRPRTRAPTSYELHLHKPAPAISTACRKRKEARSAAALCYQRGGDGLGAKGKGERKATPSDDGARLAAAEPAYHRAEACSAWAGQAKERPFRAPLSAPQQLRASPL